MISVVMSIYNGNPFYIMTAINSILNQTYSNFEFIIVNDGSDEYVEYLLADINDNRVHIIKNTNNLGLTKSLNRALEKSTCKYIARMDADDIAMPQRFEKQLEFLEKNSDYVMCGTKFKEILHDKIIAQRLFFVNTDDEIKNMIFKFNPFNHSSIMMRADVVKRIGGYDERYRYSQDYALWLKMIRQGKVLNLSEELIIRRMEDNISIKNEKIQKLISVKIRHDAIQTGNFSWINYIYLLRPLLVAYLPDSIKKFYRKVKYRNCI